LGLDYRAAAPHRLVGCSPIDVHTHVHRCPTTAAFFEAADTYGIGRIVSMSPLADVPGLLTDWPGRLEFIAVPRWRELANAAHFQRQWLADLETFRTHGARVMKFWAAPRLRGDLGLTIDHDFFGPLIREGLELGYDFMVHVGDPSPWFAPGGQYADASRYGTKLRQYEQLEFLLEAVAPRFVIAAHLGGSVEEPDFLQGLLDRYSHLYLDCSATKWIVRGVADQPEWLRAFFVQNADRILFGTDIVVDGRFDFEHYASRYWAHQTMWETAYRGESPIDDPDADGAPRLAGIDLPMKVLEKLYVGNARRLGFGEGA
jgi:predicted TIM-barrel fold metal-dependent hydrolase